MLVVLPLVCLCLSLSVCLSVSLSLCVSVCGELSIGPDQWVPQPNRSDWEVVYDSYSKHGAVIYSSHWMGWSPCPAPCGARDTHIGIHIKHTGANVV
jgi:hypothetical protein